MSVVREKLGIWTEDELADALGIKKLTLQTWRSEGHGPKYIRLGKTVYYRVRDVAEWIEAAQG